MSRKKWDGFGLGASKHGFDLDADVIGGAVKPSTATAVSNGEPLFPDDDETDLDRCEGVLDVFSKVFSKWDSIDVAKDGVPTESGDEPIVNSTADVPGVGAAVAEEDGIWRDTTETGNDLSGTLGTMGRILGKTGCDGLLPRRRDECLADDATLHPANGDR